MVSGTGGVRNGSKILEIPGTRGFGIEISTVEFSRPNFTEIDHFG